MKCTCISEWGKLWFRVGGLGEVDSMILFLFLAMNCDVSQTFTNVAGSDIFVHYSLSLSKLR